ncbi:DUF1214 domain-containing protein [Rhodococcus sp. D2-41]|uniref:DUF1214 domain-containing protein n=1 Tax=Speluncibacter jeojiensis TaxID=2710754 RepID=A0A9X4RFE6_9ACTN|nr:DUF1214 domain-containing protein [Rhodococcus sp. D2-41]MDG3009432.1 DUF1214 domain-containing protein [Rhodococcus sp. D2-41]MDG3016940.1 hypothetical protein [Corynebacteriales bacterium D3-21]
MTTDNEPTTSKVWNEFCDRLREAGQGLIDAAAPQDTLTQDEGVRYLLRLLRYSSLNNIEYSDPMYPEFTYALDPNVKCKIGADNPDNIYMSARISGKHRYRISGSRGTVPLITFGSKASRYHLDGTMASTGEISTDEIPVDADGNFSFIASVDRPAEGAWLPLAADTNGLVGRQSFQDRSTEIPAQVRIELIDEAPQPAPIDTDAFARQLKLTTAFVKGTAATFAKWTKMFMTRPNELPDWGQDHFQNAGGDPTIFYLHGYWKLAEDEAWVIETEVPDCEYWNFVLQNWWMESLDHDRMNTYINNHTAELNDDGTLTIVVAAKDPGFGNWISTAFHDEGTALMRWVGADNHPLPSCKVVKL